MKIITIPTLILFTIIFSACGAQKSETNKTRMTKEVKEIVALGKDSIVKLAFTLVDKNARLENFTKTSIQTNGKVVYVQFSNPIMYLPFNTVYYSTASVNLTSKQTSLSRISNPTDYKSEKNVPFYLQNAEATKHIEFIFKALKEVDYFDSSTPFGSTLIREMENYYQVTSGSESYDIWCKIKKTTGEIYDQGHAQIEEEPCLKDCEDTFEEIYFINNSPFLSN